MPSGDSSIRWTETNHFQTGRCELWKSVPGAVRWTRAALVAVPLGPGLEPEQTCRLLAAGAVDPLRPAQRLQILAAALLERLARNGDAGRVEASRDL